MFELDGFEIAKQGVGLVEKMLEGGILDAVLAAHLLDDQFAVAADEDFGGAELGGFAEGEDEGGVFGDVVGGDADEFSAGDEGRPVLSGEDDADAGRPGIAAASAVEIDGDGFGHVCIVERETLNRQGAENAKAGNTSKEIEPRISRITRIRNGMNSFSPSAPIRVIRGESAFSCLNGHPKTTVEELALVGRQRNPRFRQRRGGFC